MRVLPLSGLSTRRLIICSKRGSTRHIPKQISCNKGKSCAFTEDCASGINVDKVKIFVFAVSGFLSALAGLIVTSRLSSAQPTAGVTYELDAIAAVVVGGTSLMGGKGRVMGTLIGALIIGFLNNALNLLDISSYYQMIAKALVILVAVLADNYLGSKKL